MHFEVSDQTIRQWHAEGRLGGAAPTVAPDDLLTLGDRGLDVVLLQKRFNGLGANLDEDDTFGPGTRAAVTAFQAPRGLPPDGAVGRATRAALGV